jgi:hypothetical protein
VGKSFDRFALTGVLLYAATLAVLLWKRPIGDFPLPSIWFYFAWAVLPTLAGMLPLLADAKSAWIRFPQFLVAMLLYGIAWVGQARVAPPMLRHIGDGELMIGFFNFWTNSYSLLSYSLLAAFLCLGWATTRIDWAAWGRDIWSGKADAMLAKGQETMLRRAIRIIVAAAVGTSAALMLFDVVRTTQDSYMILPTRAIVDTVILLACQLLTIFASWQLARRKRGVMLALTIVSTYLLAIAVVLGQGEYALMAVPATACLVCAAALTRGGRVESDAYG